MALENILLWTDMLSLILLLVTLKFIIKNREFEKQEAENSLNTFLFGIFFLMVVFLIYVFIDAETVYRSSLQSIIPNSEVYVGYLISIIDVGLIPLFAICFFVSIFLAREYLRSYPLLQ